MRRSAVGILIIAVVLIAADSQAIDGHSPPMVIPAAAFHNDGDDPSGFYFHPNGFIEGDGAPVTMVAAVYLPDSATVESLTLHAVDWTNSCAVPSVNAWLYRVPIIDSVLTTMAAVATSGSSSAMQTPTDTSVSGAVIHNNMYRYFVRVDLCSQLHDFYAVEIGYSE
jgi:hypothetical protein